MKGKEERWQDKLRVYLAEVKKHDTSEWRQKDKGIKFTKPNPIPMYIKEIHTFIEEQDQ